MAKKTARPPNTPNAIDQPDDKKNELGSESGGETASHETLPQVPGGATGSPSENQKAATDSSFGIEVQPFNPSELQTALEQRATADSMDSLMEDKQTLTSRDDNEEKTNEAETAARAEPDSINEIRRSLKEGDKPKDSPSLTPGVLNWWERTFLSKARKNEDDAGLDARLNSESISLHANPTFEMPSIEEVHVGELFSKPEEVSGTDAPLEKAEVNLGDATRIEGAAEPVSHVSGSETQTRPVEETHDIQWTSSESYDNIRETALQDFEEVPPEADNGSLISLLETLRRTLRELHPSDKRLLIGGCILIFGIALIIAAYATITGRPKQVMPTASVSLGTSHPAAIDFPGGWEFSLEIGKLQGDKWSPQGAEWLEGTEVSRWVSLPWSLQLEAVFRTLKSGDTLDLVMSNSDHLEYKVQSVQQRNVDQMVGIDKKVPSLVVFLVNHDSKETWVITAIP